LIIQEINDIKAIGKAIVGRNEAAEIISAAAKRKS
jgi:hypothetical protein